MWLVRTGHGYLAENKKDRLRRLAIELKWLVTKKLGARKSHCLALISGSNLSLRNRCGWNLGWSLGEKTKGISTFIAVRNNSSVLRESRKCHCVRSNLAFSFLASCSMFSIFYLQEYFKCPYDEKCKMDISNRRFCKRCRLRKCFEIGMRKEYILTEEEKARKRQKIEENRWVFRFWANCVTSIVVLLRIFCPPEPTGMEWNKPPSPWLVLESEPLSEAINLFKSVFKPWIFWGKAKLLMRKSPWNYVFALEIKKVIFITPHLLGIHLMKRNAWSDKPFCVFVRNVGSCNLSVKLAARCQEKKFKMLSCKKLLIWEDWTKLQRIKCRKGVCKTASGMGGVGSSRKSKARQKKTKSSWCAVHFASASLSPVHGLDRVMMWFLWQVAPGLACSTIIHRRCSQGPQNLASVYYPMITLLATTDLAKLGSGIDLIVRAAWFFVLQPSLWFLLIIRF